MDKNDQIPIEFYYHEVFNSLLKSVISTQRKESGIPLRVNEVNSMRRRFISKVSRENINYQDCLKTLYSLALISNSRTPIPEQKSDVKRNLLDKLTRDYLNSEFARFTDNEFKVRTQLSIDFPNFASFDQSEIEGKKLNSPVHKVEEMFFSTYDSILKKNSYFKKHPLSRKMTLKKTQKQVKYKAPLGKMQKLLLAGFSIATAAQLLSLAPLPEVHTIESPTPIEYHQDNHLSHEKSSEEIALEHIYSQPNSITKLGIPLEIADQFSKYIQYRNRLDQGLELTSEQKDEYDSMRIFLIDSITTVGLDRAISNSFYTAPDSISVNAPNGYSADVSFRVGEEDYTYKIQNINDLNGNSQGVYGSELAQSICSRDIFNNKKSNGHENLDGDSRDDLDSAIDSALKFSLKTININKENGIITEEENPNILTQLGIESAEQDLDER